jgi:hypothetical protein
LAVMVALFHAKLENIWDGADACVAHFPCVHSVIGAQ